MGKICNSMYNHSASYTLRTPDESQGEKAEDPDFEEICQMKPLWASVLPNNPSQQLNRRESSHSLSLASLAPSGIVLHGSGFMDLQENDRDVQERLAGSDW